MKTKKEYIETCKHDKHIYSLGTRWCDNGYEQNLYDCKNCPGYEPIGEVEISTTEGEPIYIEVKDGPLHSDEVIKNKPMTDEDREAKNKEIIERILKVAKMIENYYRYGHDINLHIEKAANNIKYENE